MSSKAKTSPETTAGGQLEAVFQAVLDEARANPEFAGRLRKALSAPASARGNVSTVKPGKPPRASAPGIHAVNILRQHGEQMLRGRLSSLRTKSELMHVAKRSGLRLTGKSAKKSATRDDLIEGVVAAALQYDSQRGSSDG